MHARGRRLYWQLTAMLLAAHYAGWAGGLPLAIGLNVVQALHFAARRRDWQALDVQVRIGFLGLLVIGTAGPLWPIHVLQFVGVNATLVVEYCLLARLLALFPWNRSQPLTVQFVRRALLTPPAPGPITRHLAEPPGMPAPAR